MITCQLDLDLQDQTASFTNVKGFKINLGIWGYLLTYMYRVLPRLRKQCCNYIYL